MISRLSSSIFFIALSTKKICVSHVLRFSPRSEHVFKSTGAVQRLFVLLREEALFSRAIMLMIAFFPLENWLIIIYGSFKELI